MEHFERAAYEVSQSARAAALKGKNKPLQRRISECTLYCVINKIL